MKKLAKVLIGVVALLLVLVVGAFGAVNFVSWNAYKGMIADNAREATGRELAIEGDLDGSLSLGGELRIEANGVRIANAKGAAKPEMLKLGSLSLRMQLIPFLTDDRVVIDSIVVKEPVINLEVDDKGRPNWAMKDKAAPAR